MTQKLLIIDDEPNLLYSMTKALGRESLNILNAETAAEGIRLVRTERPHAVILDVRLPDGYGLDVFNEIRAIDASMPVIVITAFSSMETAVEAMKRGAYEYLLKPIELDRLREHVERALEISRNRDEANLLDGAEPRAGQRIVGHSPAIQEVFKAIGRVARQDITVLIQGESGSGKELIAEAIREHSARAEGPFLTINCAAIPETILESELFGHERGAFTGADRQRIGKFEQVDGGTLFLDEIGDMSAASQAKVLRLLQDGSFQRVGGNETLRANVRVIAATNRNLDEMVAEGTFREDLYYRLREFVINVPPLRDRIDDLEPLVAHFVATFNRELGRQVRVVTSRSDAAARNASMARQCSRIADRRQVRPAPRGRRYGNFRLTPAGGSRRPWRREFTRGDRRRQRRNRGHGPSAALAHRSQSLSRHSLARSIASCSKKSWSMSTATRCKQRKCWEFPARRCAIGSANSK